MRWGLVASLFIAENEPEVTSLAYPIESLALKILDHPYSLELFVTIKLTHNYVYLINNVTLLSFNLVYDAVLSHIILY